jgi:hypothetical protein
LRKQSALDPGSAKKLITYLILIILTSGISVMEANENTTNINKKDILPT